MAAPPAWLQCLLLAYPLLVHLAVTTGSGALSWLALTVLAANMLAPWLVSRRSRVWARPALGLAMLVCGGLVQWCDVRLFLYAAPVLIALALAWFFGRTLRPGQTPMISRIATAMRGPLPAPVARYTRRVTRFWTLLMLTIAMSDLALALWASPLVWSLFTNGVFYLLLAVVFVFEWLLRCWYPRGYEPLTWQRYLGALTRIDYRRLFVHG